MLYKEKQMRKGLIVLSLAIAPFFAPGPASAQSEPFIGQIMWVGFNYCPRDWAPANGQLLQVSQNTALF